MMNKDLLEYHLNTLYECDPDYIVDVLDITTEDLLDKFYPKAAAYIMEEFGDD